MKIFKQKLKRVDLQTISLPWNSNILTVQIQNDEPVIWYECEPNNSLTDIKIAMYPTGLELPHNVGRYIATIQLENGSVVIHVYCVQ